MADPIRQQLVAARRNQILDAATAVFAEKGFHPATIRDVARQAGIADGTIYNYFEDKSALLLGVFERMRATIVDAEPGPAAGTGDLRSFLRALIATPLDALKADEFALFRIVVSEMMVDAELRQRYSEKILAPTLAVAEAALQERAAAEGMGLSAEEARLTVRAVSAAVMGLMLAYMLGDETTREQWQSLQGFLAESVSTRLEAGAE